MPQFTLHRNHFLRTTKGQSVRFKKGQPTHVPPVCIEEAVAIGAVPVNPEDGDVIGEEAKVEPSLPPAERKAKVFEAFGIMKTRKERNDFTASGMPNNRRLPALLGFELTNKERDAYWLEYRQREQEVKYQDKLDRQAEATG